jgi:hypothetical protein
MPKVGTANPTGFFIDVTPIGLRRLVRTKIGNPQDTFLVLLYLTSVKAARTQQSDALRSATQTIMA